MDQFPSGYIGMGNNPAMLTDPTGTQVTGGNQIGVGNSFKANYVADENPSMDWGDMMDNYFMNKQSGHGGSVTTGVDGRGYVFDLNGAVTFYAMNILRGKGSNGGARMTKVENLGSYKETRYNFEMYMKAELLIDGKNILDINSFMNNKISELGISMSSEDGVYKTLPFVDQAMNSWGMTDNGVFILWNSARTIAQGVDGYTDYNNGSPIIGLSPYSYYDQMTFHLLGYTNMRVFMLII